MRRRAAQRRHRWVCGDRFVALVQYRRYAAWDFFAKLSEGLHSRLTHGTASRFLTLEG